MCLRAPRHFRLALLGIAALALCGCVSPVVPDTLPAWPALPRIPPASPPWSDAADGYLLVRDESGNLLIADPHSDRRLALTTDASAQVQYVQPTWSTTSEWIAWVRTEQTPSGLRGVVEVASLRGEVWLRENVPFPPFYLSWNNDSTQLSFLSNWREDGRWTIGLNVLTLDSVTDTWSRQLVDTGRPFYYTWAPQGDNLLIHHSLNQVYLQQETEVLTLTHTAAPFGAPQWSPDGQFVLYGDLRDGVGSLRQDFLDTERARTLGYFQGKHLGLFLNATGKHLAVTETSDMWSVNVLGPLYLYDLETQTVQKVTGGPVIAAFWSPDGNRLLFYELEPQGAAPNLRLRIWEAETVRDLVMVVPPRMFLQRYLAFSDQYALSHRLWSPDSRHIVFTAQEPDGRSAIYVQAVTADAEPERLMYGDLAFWSHR